MSKSALYWFSVGVLLLLCAGCGPKKESPVVQVQPSIQYPVITITDDYSMEKEYPLYDLSKEFVKNLILGGDNYDGTY